MSKRDPLSSCYINEEYARNYYNSWEYEWRVNSSDPFERAVHEYRCLGMTRSHAQWKATDDFRRWGKRAVYTSEDDDDLDWACELDKLEDDISEIYIQQMFYKCLKAIGEVSTYGRWGDKKDKLRTILCAVFREHGLEKYLTEEQKEIMQKYIEDKDIHNHATAAEACGYKVQPNYYSTGYAMKLHELSVILEPILEI